MSDKILPNPFRPPPPDPKIVVELEKTQPHVAFWIKSKLRTLQYEHRETVVLTALAAFIEFPLKKLVSAATVLIFTTHVKQRGATPLATYLASGVSEQMWQESLPRINKFLRECGKQLDVDKDEERAMTDAANEIFYSLLWMETKYENVRMIRKESER